VKTLYAACLARLGLSQSEAAAVHGVRLDTVKSWSSGRNPVPQGAWDDLRALEERIVAGANSMLEAWKRVGSPPVEVNDAEGDPVTRLIVAAFVLSATGSVEVGETAATRAARQARRPD